MFILAPTQLPQAVSRTLILQFASIHVTAVTGPQVGGAAEFWMLRNVLTRCETQQAFYLVVTGGSFIAGTATGAWSWPLTSIKSRVRNEWSYPAAPAVSLHGVNRNNLTSFVLDATPIVWSVQLLNRTWRNTETANPAVGRTAIRPTVRQAGWLRKPNREQEAATVAAPSWPSIWVREKYRLAAAAPTGCTRKTFTLKLKTSNDLCKWPDPMCRVGCVERLWEWQCVCIRCSPIYRTITMPWKGFELTTKGEQYFNDSLRVV